LLSGRHRSDVDVSPEILSPNPTHAAQVNRPQYLQSHLHHHPHLQHILSNQDISMLRKGSPSQSHQSIGNSSSSTTASGASTPLSVKEALPRYIWDQKLSSSE